MIESDKKINVLDHGYVRLVSYMQPAITTPGWTADLEVVRNARVSYDADWRTGEDEGKDAKLLDYLVKNSHTSPLEAVVFTFEVKAPLFVLRQWHRHRTWSFCLSGDTDISFELPCRVRAGGKAAKKVKLSDLYEKWNTESPKRARNRPYKTLTEHKRRVISGMSLRVFDEKSKSFTVGHIADVMYSGVKQVFEITLADGKKLKASKDHRLLTTQGWSRLEDAVGLVVSPGGVAGMTKEAFVLTNGVPAYQSKSWMQELRESGASVQEMADSGNCSYHTIRKWLKVHSLNFTKSEAASRASIWNKGVTGYKHKNFKHSEQGLARIRAARSGDKSNWWKGGVTTERAAIAAWSTGQASKVHASNDWKCVECGSNKNLECHHIKPVVTHPELGREISNLTTLCRMCHCKTHGFSGENRRGKGVTLTARESKVVSVRLVGEEPTYDIAVAGDNHNFVANGLIVHNSEVSARYSELPEEFYVPEVAQITTQSTSNKQMRTDEEHPEAYHMSAAIKQACKASFEVYKDLMKQGCPRELARGVLPLNTYSHMFCTVDLHNLAHFLRLRLHSHSQYEIRVFAQALLDLITPVVPVLTSSLKKHRLT